MIPVVFGRKPKTLTFEEFKAEALKVRAKNKAQAETKKTAKTT